MDWIISSRFKKDVERFKIENSCSDVFDYSDLLFIKIKEKDCYYFNPTILEIDGDYKFSIKVNVILDDPDEERVFGVIFNYEDENNFSVLKLSGNKLYAISSFHNGAESELVPWTKLDMTFEKGSINYDLFLTFWSQELILEINDIELNRLPFQPLSKMQCGLFSRGKGLSVVKEFGEIVFR